MARRWSEWAGSLGTAHREVKHAWGWLMRKRGRGGKTRSPIVKRRRLFRRRGGLDESERVFSREERGIAALLSNEGRRVKAQAEVPEQRSGDAKVDGVLAEFKSLAPGATSATVRNVINNSVRRSGQARHMFLDARGSGMTRAEAERGFARARNIARGRIDSIRIKGDRFDITSVDFQ